jgi:Zn finger protein HypA/HybF involved in hydrogenase expression
MTANTFHCMRCGKNRNAKTMRSVLLPGKDAGVSMNFYRAKCPVCGSTMMKIKGIAACTKKRR